ncbi:MAG: cbb3-type cytochrome oxidase assembly protein CcoS [Candidatus Zixiibacteriota bacterium]|nr:MAG: cbb3-type cytochrome oxidase assembly protein CcoS [candidate division Zixibacteria bacterium]
MEVMFVLVGASLVVAGGFLVAFLWALRRGQFDDLDTPAMRALFESKMKSPKHRSNR